MNPIISEGKNRLEPKKKYRGISKIPRKRAQNRNANLGSDIDLRHVIPMKYPTKKI